MENALEYRSTTALVRELAARRISAVELLESTFARVDYYNPAINAIVVRDVSRARGRHFGELRLGAWRTAAAAGHTDDGQRVIQCCGNADHLGYPDV